MDSNFPAAQPEAEFDTAQAHEAARLSALEHYAILDTLPETAYDDIIFLAAQICKVPIALITLLDENRQWFKSRIGLEADQTPREDSFCTHAIRTPEQVMVVPDATLDPRFIANPLVTGSPGIRFYAGAPLITPAGWPLGTLCVIDTQPRIITANQKTALEALSRQVMSQLELRLRAREMEIQAVERQRVQDALIESEARFNAFMDNSPAVTFIKNEIGEFVYVNEVFLRVFNKRRDQLIGRRDDELWPPEIANPIREHDRSVLAGEGVVEVEETVPTPDGRSSFWISFKFPLQAGGGKKFLAGIAVDITERKYYQRRLEEYQDKLEAAVARLEEIAITDALTAINNYGAFEARLQEEWSRAARYDLPLALLMIDVDDFKLYNDSFGHLAGDEVLRQVAIRLQAYARPSDFVARYGGEEFAVILANTSLEGAAAVAERIRQAIETAPWPKRGITVSVGAANWKTEMKMPTELIADADAALYRAKRAGKNQVLTATDTAIDTASEPEASAT